MSVADVVIKIERNEDGLDVGTAVREPYPQTPSDVPALAQPEFVSVKTEPKDEEDFEEAADEPLELTTQLRRTPLKPEPFDGYEVPIKEEPTDQDENCFVQSDLATATTSGFYNDITNKARLEKFPCSECNKRFTTRSNLLRHLHTHSGDKYTCSECYREFHSKQQLHRHVRTVHNTEKTYECSDCAKKFRSSSNLVQHQRVHITVKPYTCEVCNRSFAVKANMIKHQGRSRCKKPITEPLICNVCNKVFQREFLLKSHLRMHTTERPFECATCSMHFKYKSTLIRHIQLHNNDRPYSCKICDKTFTHSGLIKPHMRKHTGEKPYICPICQKKFSYKHNMQRHTLRHNKIKHLVCEVCHKNFPKESRLKYHMRTHMEDKRPFKCDYCPKSFSHKQNIQRHYKKKHPTVKYDRPETDASIASIIWQTVLQKKMESEKDYIIPEQDWPENVPIINDENDIE